MVRRRQRPSLLKRLWVEDYTSSLSNTLLGSGGLLAGLDGLNYVLQSAQFTSLLSYMTVPKEVYITIAVIGLLTFLAHGRDNA